MDRYIRKSRNLEKVEATWISQNVNEIVRGYLLNVSLKHLKGIYIMTCKRVLLFCLFVGNLEKITSVAIKYVDFDIFPERSELSVNLISQPLHIAYKNYQVNLIKQRRLVKDDAAGRGTGKRECVGEMDS